MKRVRIVGAAVAVVMSVGVWAAASHASPVEAPAADVMRVYGQDVPGLEGGIAWWNRAAGREVMRYAGAEPATPDPQTVIVSYDWIPGYDGIASGVVGSTPIEIRINPLAMLDWTVYAHELGHTLGLDDFNTGLGYGTDQPSYNGVMSYQSGQHPNSADDRALISAWR